MDANSKPDLAPLRALLATLQPDPWFTCDAPCCVEVALRRRGDTLLISGNGRTDLPTGDPEALYDSLFNRLLKLDPTQYEQEAQLLDRGMRVTRESAMAKLFASDVAMKVAVDAVQILGGYGYMRDYPVEKYMRDAKITQIYEGTNQIQRNVIAANMIKETLKK